MRLYSRFNVSNKLRGILGKTEEQIAVASVSGSDKGASRKLQHLMPQSTTGNTLLTRRVLPESQVLSNMTGHALWQSFSNAEGDPSVPTDSPVSPSVTQKNKYEDLVDELNTDFTQQSKMELELQERVSSYEGEIARQEDLAGQGNKQKHTTNSKETASKLREAKIQLQNLKLKKAKTLEKLDDAQKELSIKKSQ